MGLRANGDGEGFESCLACGSHRSKQRSHALSVLSGRLERLLFVIFFKKQRSRTSSSRLLLLLPLTANMGDGKDVLESHHPGLTSEAATGALLAGLPCSGGSCGSPRLLLLLDRL